MTDTVQQDNVPLGDAQIVEKLFEEINSSGKEDDLKYFQNVDCQDLIGLHRGFGTYLRNRFNLWQLVEGDSRHPDTRSMEIISLLWQKINPSKEFTGYCKPDLKQVKVETTVISLPPYS